MEENKVAQIDERVRHRFIQIVHSVTCTRPETLCGMNDQKCKRIGDAILQSPDLRVTLVRPQFHVVDCTVRDSRTTEDYVIGGFLTPGLAQEYADFKNSAGRKHKFDAVNTDEEAKQMLNDRFKESK